MMREQKNELCWEETRIGDAAWNGASVKEDGALDALRSSGAERGGAQHMAMRDVTAGYHGHVVLDGLRFEVPRGGILVLIGPNGAGKSTVLKTLSRALQPMQGIVTLDGLDLQHFSGEALAREVAVMLTDRAKPELMTVRDVASLGRYPYTGRLGRLDAEDEAQVKDAMEVMDVMALRERDFRELSDGQKQRVLLARALAQDPKLLILDEPTASLTPQEINELMDIIHNLTAAGKSIIIITHKLKEIKESSDNCTIIRRGKYIDTVRVADVSEDDLAAMMVGRQVTNKVDKKEMEPGRVVVEVKDLHAKDYRGVEVLKGLNLEVHAGEILGLAGIDGNGQSQLVEILTGLGKATSGQVIMNGKDVTNETPKMLFDEGISSIPEDRQKHGLVLDFSVAENLVLQNYAVAPYAKNGILQKKVIREHATDMIRDFDIRPVGCEERLAGQLSGGNQQKVIIAREVTNDKDFLIAFNPTRGLDVGAIEFVHKYLVAQRNKGRAILLVSFELDEIMNLSDRIDVIFDGQIDGEMMGAEADEYKLGLMMAGGKAE